MVLGLISDNNEQPYQNQVAGLALWCQSNNLTQNVYKTRGMVVDFWRKQDSGYTPPSPSAGSLWRGSLVLSTWGCTSLKT